jgi:hypothetical protein
MATNTSSANATCGGFRSSCATLTSTDVWQSDVGSDIEALCWALLFGFCIGLQREFRFDLATSCKRHGCMPGRASTKPRKMVAGAAGLRTHVLVSIGACLFTLESQHGFHNALPVALGKGGDPARIAAQIVSGIGFLGAGVIFKTDDKVQGLTTAASIWTTAALGLSCASRAGKGLNYTAGFATALVLATLQFVVILEEWAHLWFQPSKAVRQAMREEGLALSRQNSPAAPGGEVSAAAAEEGAGAGAGAGIELPVLAAVDLSLASCHEGGPPGSAGGVSQNNTGHGGSGSGGSGSGSMRSEALLVAGFRGVKKRDLLSVLEEVHAAATKVGEEVLESGMRKERGKEGGQRGGGSDAEAVVVEVEDEAKVQGGDGGGGGGGAATRDVAVDAGAVLWVTHRVALRDREAKGEVKGPPPDLQFPALVAMMVGCVETRVTIIR